MIVYARRWFHFNSYKNASIDYRNRGVRVCYDYGPSNYSGVNEEHKQFYKAKKHQQLP